MAGWGAVCEQAALVGWASLAEEDDSDEFLLGRGGVSNDGNVQGSGVPAPLGGGDRVVATQPQIADAILHSLWPVTPPVWQPAHLQRTFNAIVEGCRSTPAPSVDVSLTPIAEFFVQHPSRLHGSKAAISKLMGVEPKKVEPHLMALADSMLQLDHCKRQALERSLTQSGAQLLLYTDVVRYDETPMKVGQRQLPEDLGIPSHTTLGGIGAPHGPMPHAELQGGSLGRAASQAKLLATDSKFVMLVKFPSDGAPSLAGRYVHLMGSSLTSLQVVERTTGPVLKRALLENNFVSEHSNSFQFKCRMVTTDMHPGNLAAEKLVMKDRPGWSHLHFGCNVHVAARAHSKTFSLVPAEITGLLNFALSLSQGSAMVQFRKALVKVLTRKITFLYGSATEECQQYRSWILDVFAKTGAKKEVKNHILRRLPNGNWQNVHQVEVYLKPGLQHNLPALRKQVISSFVTVFTSRAFKVYPRHRWVGADIAMDQVGLMESVHGLATSVYQAMVENVGPSSLPVSFDLDSFHEDLPDSPVALHQVQQRTRPPGVAAASAGHGREDVGPSVGQAESIEDPTSTAADFTQHMAAENARQRRVAAQWLASNPLPMLIVDE